MKSLLRALYIKFISGKQKAIVALVTPFVVELVAHVAHVDAGHLVQVITASGVVSGLGVFYKANK